MSVFRPSFRIALTALAGAAALAGCATGSGYGAPASGAFSADDFGWSTRAGQGGIDGRIAYQQGGQPYSCTGSIGLTPVTPYTRARFQALYGSTERAALPPSVVRARNVEDAGADYRGFVRSATCEAGRFSFEGLPDGNWFIIAPVSAAGGGDPMVLMRRVETRGGRVISVTL
jgi:hypothetical protein